METAEFGDLLERERTIVDQPGGGRMGHQGLGHWLSPELETNRAAPHGAASVAGDVTLRRRRGKGAHEFIAMYRGWPFIRSIHCTTLG
jgi:hypothetical protein